MTVDPHTFLRTRRSIRHFRPDPVSGPVIERIIETAAYAPSAHNKQPWRFVAITSPAVKAALAGAITHKFLRDSAADNISVEEVNKRVERTIRRTKEAPVVIVLCRDTSQVDQQPDAARKQVETTMGTQSGAAAGLQLVLAAHAEGLGGGWICWPLFTPAEVYTVLNLPPSWEPQAMFFIGYAAEQPEPPERKPINEILVTR